MKTSQHKIDNLDVNIKWGQIRGFVWMYLISILVILSSAVAYLVVVFLNHALTYFNNTHHILRANFGVYLTPNLATIRYPATVGVVTIFIVTVLVLFLHLIFKRIKSNTVKSSILIAEFGFILVSLVLISLSEYSYARFSVLYQTLGSEYYKQITLTAKPGQFQEAITNIHNYYVSNHHFGWTNETDTWWMLFVRLTIVVVCFILTQGRIGLTEKYAQEVARNIELNIKKTNLGTNRISKLYNHLFVSNERGVSVWMMVVTIITLLPQMIYVVRISVATDQIYSLVRWSSIVQHFSIHDMTHDWDAFNTIMQNKININLFAVVDLPIICVGFSVATTFVFMSVVIRQWKTSTPFFFTQFIISLVELTITLVINAYSKGSINKLVNAWNQNDMWSIIYALKISGNAMFDIFTTNLYHLPIFNDKNTLNYMWLYGLEYVSEVVISFAFMGTTYCISGHKIWNISRLRKAEMQKIMTDTENVVDTAIKATSTTQ